MFPFSPIVAFGSWALEARTLPELRACARRADVDIHFEPHYHLHSAEGDLTVRYFVQSTLLGIPVRRSYAYSSPFFYRDDPTTPTSSSLQHSVAILAPQVKHDLRTDLLGFRVTYLFDLSFFMRARSTVTENIARSLFDLLSAEFEGVQSTHHLMPSAFRDLKSI